MPETARRHLNSPHLGIGVSAKYAVEPAERPQALLRKEAFLLQQHVQRDATVPLGKNESVTLRPLGVVWIVAEHAVEEHAQELDRRERRSEMATAAAAEHGHEA